MADIKDSLDLDNIHELTIFATYDDIMGFTDFDARYPWVYHFAFDDDIQELVTLLTTMTGIWTFDWFCRYQASFLILLQCCTRYDDIDHISLTIDDVTIFSIRFDYSAAFDDIHN